eukprot:3695831-Rhodomonas_salina.1
MPAIRAGRSGRWWKTIAKSPKKKQSTVTVSLLFGRGGHETKRFPSRVVKMGPLHTNDSCMGPLHSGAGLGRCIASVTVSVERARIRRAGARARGGEQPLARTA